ncbi:MAG: homoserine O-acetyltransferase [Bacteroidetes bacterium]|nr:MAG: homoserine O-acetyltransferase [Bacteroidota bacterium]
MQTFSYPEAFELESGAVLPGFDIAYRTYGTPTQDPDRVIWVCHALTANAEVADWWPHMVGRDLIFDPRHHFIVCANMLGSCYGSTHALSLHPETGAPWYHDFPLLTNRDIVRAFDLLRQHLGLDRIRTLIGGSLGGQQVLEWALLQPDVFAEIIPIATNARHSAWGIAFNESQRLAIQADPTWHQDRPDAGLIGLKAARSIALLSYRGYRAYTETQTDPESDRLEAFRATTYQQYQGEKLVSRFNAYAYWTLSKAMDSHHLGRGRGSVETALAQIKARTLVIGVDTDGLFPVEEQQLLARHIPRARYHEIQSPSGHDGFLIETGQISEAIRAFWSEAPASLPHTSG